MSKNNNLHIKFILIQRCRVLKLAFNKFKKAVNKIKIFDTDDEVLFKLTLNNLLAEIKTATKVMERRDK